MNELTELKAEIDKHREELDAITSDTRVQAITLLNKVEFYMIRKRIIDLIETLIEETK